MDWSLPKRACTAALRQAIESNYTSIEGIARACACGTSTVRRWLDDADPRSPSLVQLKRIEQRLPAVFDLVMKNVFPRTALNAKPRDLDGDGDIDTLDLMKAEVMSDAAEAKSASIISDCLGRQSLTQQRAAEIVALKHAENLNNDLVAATALLMAGM